VRDPRRVCARSRARGSPPRTMLLVTSWPHSVRPSRSVSTGSDLAKPKEPWTYARRRKESKVSGGVIATHGDQ
jgi:hypothetical protein